MNHNDHIVNIHCIYCGEIISEVEASYLEENPNASDIWIEDISRQHGCRDEEEIICHECGESLGTYDPGYREEYPNGFSIWVEQLHEQHECYCPAILNHELDYRELDSIDTLNKRIDNRSLSRADWKLLWGAIRAIKSLYYYPKGVNTLLFYNNEHKDMLEEKKSLLKRGRRLSQYYSHYKGWSSNDYQTHRKKRKRVYLSES